MRDYGDLSMFGRRGCNTNIIARSLTRLDRSKTINLLHHSPIPAALLLGTKARYEVGAGVLPSLLKTPEVDGCIWWSRYVVRRTVNCQPHLVVGLATADRQSWPVSGRGYRRPAALIHRNEGML